MNKEQLIKQVKSFHKKWIDEKRNIPYAFTSSHEGLYAFVADFVLSIQPLPEDVSKEQALRVIGWLWGNDNLKNIYATNKESNVAITLLNLASKISNDLNDINEYQAKQDGGGI